MRKSIDGLASIIQNNFQLDPFSNALFLFCGRPAEGCKKSTGNHPCRSHKRINQLFEVEKRLEVLTPEKRKKERRILETEILDEFWTWAESVLKDVDPESKLGKAFTYAFNQKEGLMNYLLDGNCESKRTESNEIYTLYFERFTGI